MHRECWKGISGFTWWNTNLRFTDTFEHNTNMLCWRSDKPCGHHE